MAGVNATDNHEQRSNWETAAANQTFSPPHVGTGERQTGEGERHLGNPSMLLY